MNSTDKLESDINKCRACSLYKNGKAAISREGSNIKSKKVKLMVIGEAPDKAASEVGIPFYSGEISDLLNIWLNILCPEEDFVIVNAVKHYPVKENGDWRSPTEEEINVCHQFLDKQIDIYKPRNILCLGDVACFAITNKHDLKKNIINFNATTYKNIRCLFYYHPGYVIKNKIEWKEYILKLQEIL